MIYVISYRIFPFAAPRVQVCTTSGGLVMSVAVSSDKKVLFRSMWRLWNLFKKRKLGHTINVARVEQDTSFKT
jgi:hypothetical protein